MLPITDSIGLGILIQMIIIHSIIIRKYFNAEEGKKIWIVLNCIVILGAIYILLLLLGGFLTYRLYIVRMDTPMLITLALIFYFDFSTHYLIKNLQLNQRISYFVALFLYTEMFITADWTFQKDNTCERNALLKIAQSPEQIVFLDNDCPVLAWNKLDDYRDSEPRVAMLQRWGVIHEKNIITKNKNGLKRIIAMFACKSCSMKLTMKSFA